MVYGCFFMPKKKGDISFSKKPSVDLKDILVIVLFATLANADDWVEIALFAESY